MDKQSCVPLSIFHFLFLKNSLFNLGYVRHVEQLWTQAAVPDSLHTPLLAMKVRAPMSVEPRLGQIWQGGSDQELTSLSDVGAVSDIREVDPIYPMQPGLLFQAPQDCSPSAVEWELVALQMFLDSSSHQSQPVW